MTKCQVRGCEKEARHTMNVIGYDIPHCFKHCIGYYFRTLKANIDLKIYFYKYDRIKWPVFSGLFQMPRRKMNE